MYFLYYYSLSRVNNLHYGGNCQAKKELIYPFCFSTTNERLCLTQEQLDRIHYLSTLLTNEENFLSIENENGDYVLNPPISHNLFLPILRSITSKQPYILFNELSEDENVLNVLQLFDSPPFERTKFSSIEFH